MEGVANVVEAQTAAQIANLLLEHAEVLDSNRLERWPELYLPEGCYRVLSRENLTLGLPAPIMYYYSQGMLKDRVTALRDALTYESVYTRHITSAPQLWKSSCGDLAARSNFAIYQSTEKGESRLYAVGEYRDVLTRRGERFQFRSRDVILDTFAVPNNIAHPL